MNSSKMEITDNLVHNQNFIKRSKYCFLVSKQNLGSVMFWWLLTFIFQVIFGKILIESILLLKMDKGLGFLSFILLSIIVFLVLIVIDSRNHFIIKKQAYFNKSFNFFRNYIIQKRITGK